MLSDDDGDVSDHIADLLSQNRSTNQLTDLDLVSAAVPVSLSAARPHLDLAMERPLSPLELSPPRPATMETMLSPLVAVVLPSLEEESAGSGTSRASSSRRTTVRPQKRATARRQSTQNVQVCKFISCRTQIIFLNGLNNYCMTPLYIFLLNICFFLGHERR
jgi:hypothetical protein